MTHEVTEKRRYLKHGSFFAAGGCAILGFALCFFWMTRDSEEQELHITGPGGWSLNAGAKNSKVNYQDLLNRLHDDDFGRDGLIGWLAAKGYFNFGDPRFVTALSERLCEPIPNEPLSAKIKAGKKCSDLPVAKGLRNLASLYQVPFHHVGTIINVGISLDSEHRPPEGKANVCQERELRGKKIALTDLRSKQSIEVVATGRYACREFSRYPDLQLNSNDADKLFSGPLDEYQKAIAVVLD